MKKTNLLLIHLFIIILLFSSNQIIGSVPWQGYVPIRTGGLLGTSKQPVSVDYYLGTLAIRQDLLDTLEISGSAIAKDENGVIAQDRIEIMFRSTENTYTLIPIMQERFDKNKRELVAKGLGEVRHGFVAKTSLLRMKNGDYSIILACYQGDNLVGLVDTEASLEKSSRGLNINKK